MKLIRILDRINNIFEKAFIAIGGTLLVFMVLITCINIVLRWFWVPLRGTFELMGLMGAVVASFALAYTQARKEHISVDILIQTFTMSLRRLLAVINDLACICFSVIASWQIIKIANNLFASGELTETLGIIFYPFTYAVAFGFIALSLIFFTDICKFLFTKGDK
ncbi:MAG TPA: TRAP transporter small permease [Sedimentisphaerales bacterium]|nr:TRAP transporter small permease [Sedimentisphaerales bacterium]